MHEEDTTVIARTLATFTLAGHELPVIEYHGRAVMFARNVAEVLEYEDANKLGEYIGGKWRGRLREGTDYVRLTGDDLAALKAVDLPSIRGKVDAHARSVVLLTEAGAQVAAMLSRTAVGDRVRWDIVDVLIPALRKLAAPPPPPQKLLAGPVDLLKEAVRLDADVLARSCGATWLRAQARAAAERELAEAARAVDECKRERAAVRRSAREERAAAAGRRRERKTTLW